MTSLWRNFIGNVVANSNPSCLLISASEVHWIVTDCCQTERQIQQDARALRVLHVSFNNSSTRTIRKWLKRNNGYLTTLHIWMLWGYHIWRATREAILKPPSESQNSFGIKSRNREDVGQFSAGPVNNAIRSFRNSLIRVREGWRKTFWAISSAQKSDHTSVWALECLWDNFWLRLHC